MDHFIQRPITERMEFIHQTAAKLDMEPAAIEKVFWVCWLLRRLFLSPLQHSIIFKGGTSLSKAYGLIKRFSEDIDLILNWSAFCAEGNWNPGERYSNSNRQKMLKSLDDWNVRQIIDNILPIVCRCCGDICVVEVPVSSPETITVTYPKICTSSYIRPQVLLEIGPKAAWNPHTRRIIRPYMAEIYPNLFHDADAQVVVTTAERAFWEKITILHAQVHRPTPLPPRYARHYYDAAMMSRNAELKNRAFADIYLLYQVSSFKYHFYRAGWADYLNAVPGTMHLVPSGDILANLKADYNGMRREMLPADAPTLASLLDEISLLEQEINQLSPLNLNIKNYPTMEP